MSSPSPPDRGARYRVRHVTRYHYNESAVLAHHQLHLEPRALPGQRNEAWRLEIEPKPAISARHLDCYGNPVTYIALQEPHQGLGIAAEMDVEVTPPPPLDLATTPPWEMIRDGLATASDTAARKAAAFAFASPRVPFLPALVDYAAPSFASGRPIGEAGVDLAARIHRDITFDAGATTVRTPIAEVLETRRGVCQDFAHLAIGCLRAQGLAARYVSGYLRTIAPPGAPRLIGADASHAWLSLWCGDEVWLDLDPTNPKAFPSDHVTLAWGRDYGDVSPVRGALFGGGRHSLSVMVDVVPLEPASA
jgi:transglutaminase-like putative cysteine protease